MADIEPALVKNAAATLDSMHLQINQAGRQILLALGLVSNFGAAGDYAPNGRASWNWGAFAPLPGDPYIERTIVHDDGTEDTYRYASFTSQFAGLSEFLRRWVTPQILTLANKGNIDGVVRGLHSEGYFPQTTPALIQSHTQRIEENVKEIATDLGEPPLVETHTTGVAIAPILVLGTAVGIFLATLHAK